MKLIRRIWRWLIGRQTSKRATQRCSCSCANCQELAELDMADFF